MACADVRCHLQRRLVSVCGMGRYQGGAEAAALANKGPAASGLQGLGEAERAVLEQYALANSGLDSQRLQLAHGMLQQQVLSP